MQSWSYKTSHTSLLTHIPPHIHLSSHTPLLTHIPPHTHPSSHTLTILTYIPSHTHPSSHTSLLTHIPPHIHPSSHTSLLTYIPPHTHPSSNTPAHTSLLPYPSSHKCTLYHPHTPPSHTTLTHHPHITSSHSSPHIPSFLVPLSSLAVKTFTSKTELSSTYCTLIESSPTVDDWGWHWDSFVQHLKTRSLVDKHLHSNSVRRCWRNKNHCCNQLENMLHYSMHNQLKCTAHIAPIESSPIIARTEAILRQRSDLLSVSYHWN